MTVDVQTEITIQRPVDVVAAFAADPTNAPQWYDKISSAAWKTDKALRVGSQVAFVAHFLRRRLAYTYEVTDYVPGGRLTMRTAQGPFPMETTYTWTAINSDSTRMTMRNRGEPAGFSKLAAPIMTTAMRRATNKDLKKLKAILEQH